MNGNLHKRVNFKLESVNIHKENNIIIRSCVEYNLSDYFKYISILYKKTLIQLILSNTVQYRTGVI